jgi:hypothetical protein
VAGSAPRWWRRAEPWTDCFISLSPNVPAFSTAFGVRRRFSALSRSRSRGRGGAPCCRASGAGAETLVVAPELRLESGAAPPRRPPASSTPTPGAGNRDFCASRPRAGSNTGGRNRASGGRRRAAANLLAVARDHHEQARPVRRAATHVPLGGRIEVQGRSSRATVEPRAARRSCAGAPATTGVPDLEEIPGQRFTRAGADRPRPTAAGSRSTHRRAG